MSGVAAAGTIAGGAAAMDAAWSGLSILSVDIMLAVSALTLMLGDVVLPAGNKRILAWTALAQLTLCLTATFFVDLEGVAVMGAYVGDGMSVMLKRIFLVAGILAVLGGMSGVERDAPRRQGEFYQLLMFSLLGMTLLAGARDLILLLIAFELMSLPLYALAAFGRTGPFEPRKGPLPGMFMAARDRWKRPAEAGIKLFLVGAISSAIAAYGLSLMFGAAGSTRFDVLADAAGNPLLGIGSAIFIAGVGFKVGAAPFHFWVADTYQGARTPLVAFLSVAPKAAGLTALVQLLLGPLEPFRATWQPLLVLLVVLSIAVGNLFAVPQQNVKRMLAFSGVAQLGFALLAVAASGPSVALAGAAPGEGLATMLFFLCAYLVANMGIFLVVEAMGAQLHGEAGDLLERPEDDTMTTFSGLASRSPWLAMCALLFLLSLGGIPFAIGFWAKVYVLLAAWKAGFMWLVGIAALVSAAGLFYYLQVARAIYMRPAAEDAPEFRIAGTLKLAIVLCAAATVGIGLYPAPLLDAARAAARAFLG